MIAGTYHIRAIQEHFWRDGVTILPFVIDYNQRKRQKIAKIEWEEVKESTPISTGEDTFHLLPTEAQELMDDLWQCGIRPTEGTGSAGAMQEAQNHIKDLREFGTRLLAIVEKSA